MSAGDNLLRVFLESSKINSLSASGDLCHLPITFANSLNTDQDLQKVGPDLDPNKSTASTA